MDNKTDIELRYVLHQSEPVVQLIFAYDSNLIRFLKANTSALWSESLQSWYIRCREFNPEKFKRTFGQDHYLHATGQNAAAIMNHAKRVVLGSILLWAILLTACGPSTNSANTLSAIYTAAAQTIVAQQPTVEQSATPIPTDTASMLTPTDSGSTTPTN